MRIRNAPRKPKTSKPPRNVASKRHCDVETLKIFVLTFFEVAPQDEREDHYVKFDVVWRRWVWFAQTYFKTREFFPAGMPRSAQVLARLLHNHFNLSTRLQAETLKRNDLMPDKKRSNYIIAVGLKLKVRPEYWPDARLQWIPAPWLQDGSTLGTHLDGHDPRSNLVMRWRKVRGQAIFAGAKQWQAFADAEDGLDKDIKDLHKRHDIFNPDMIWRSRIYKQEKVEFEAAAELEDAYLEPPKIIPPPLTE